MGIVGFEFPGLRQSWVFAVLRISHEQDHRIHVGASQEMHNDLRAWNVSRYVLFIPLHTVLHYVHSFVHTYAFLGVLTSTS